ncbi:MAG TPA: mandelate racemase/muconate lactonizing enzyme family protein [Hyphomicrobiales bacterium]|nr:mandelate racemase/muconate lactonizing enzyme family protein [Hyphomicrobiales bacterium]
MSGDFVIERVEARAVAVPLSQTFKGSIYEVSHRTAIVTRVTTREGLVGEGLNMVGERGLLPVVRRIVLEEIAPVIVGQPVFATERCWERMDRATDHGGRDPRAGYRAMACADTAIWDAVGKAVGQPLYRLWGGFRDKLPVIAIAGYHREGDEAAFGEEMIELRALGMGGCKFKVGGDPVRDAARVRAAREAIGPDFVLCVDANRGWSRADAVDFARRIDGLGVRWFEEPCRWRNDRRDMADVRRAGGVPVCAGQSEGSAEACRDLMIDGAIDVCNFDASWGGGPTVWNRVAGTAASFGVEMAHHGEPHLGAHLLAAIAGGTYMETHHPDRDPVFHGMIVDRAPFEHGTYAIPPDRPGWGITLDADKLKAFELA